MKEPSPTLETLLSRELAATTKPLAVVLAGHNGSGKSTLWYERLASRLQIPLVNADRLTMSILPEPRGNPPMLPVWAQTLRDTSATWQQLSQNGVRLFRELIMRQKQPFAFETVFSHWEQRPDGSFASKVDEIREMQKRGYVVVLIFVGLTAASLSVLRVHNRKLTGGHDVEMGKLLQRFPRTQRAIGQAVEVADLSLLVDNSLDERSAFQFVRAQRKRRVLFDIRDPRHRITGQLLTVAEPWLTKVVGPFRAPRTTVR